MPKVSSQELVVIDLGVKRHVDASTSPRGQLMLRRYASGKLEVDFRRDECDVWHPISLDGGEVLRDDVLVKRDQELRERHVEAAGEMQKRIDAANVVDVDFSGVISGALPERMLEDMEQAELEAHEMGDFEMWGFDPRDFDPRDDNSPGVW